VKTIVIVGAGALGSHVVLFLRGLGNLRVIDFDRVEQKNVGSQFHGKPHVGKAKVVALQQTMQFLFGTKIETIPHALVADNAKELLGKADLVIDCLDNGPARRLVQEFARGAGVPCLHGALAAEGSFGRVVWDADFRIDEAAAGAATCEDGVHLPFIGIVSTYLARAAQEFIVNGRMIGFQVTPTAAALRI
jgi:molybdopterin-synthase adenylyltransferase